MPFGRDRSGRSSSRTSARRWPSSRSSRIRWRSRSITASHACSWRVSSGSLVCCPRWAESPSASPPIASGRRPRSPFRTPARQWERSALLALEVRPSALALYAYALFFGLGFGARGPIITAIASQLFAGRRFRRYLRHPERRQRHRRGGGSVVRRRCARPHRELPGRLPDRRRLLRGGSGVFLAGPPAAASLPDRGADHHLDGAQHRPYTLSSACRGKGWQSR